MNTRFPLSLYHTRPYYLVLDFVEFFRIPSRSLVLQWVETLFHFTAVALPCVCVCLLFRFRFFSHHLYSPSHFPSSGFEWALVVRIVCFLIFHSIIKSSWLLKIFFTVSVFSLYHLACDSLLLIRGAELSAVCSLVHSRIPLRFWFYFGSLHIAPVNNLKSPIYNNQWKNQAREKKKRPHRRTSRKKDKNIANKMENVCRIFFSTKKLPEWWIRCGQIKQNKNGENCLALETHKNFALRA